MAPISDFNLTLVDGGLNYSTSDLNYENSVIYVEVKQANGNTMAFSENISTGGIGGFSWYSFGYDTSPPALPLTLEFIVNDDNDPSVFGKNDSKFIYNITSATDDIFNNGNAINEGPYIDTTATDRAILSFDKSALSIENINGENFLNISGKIENYQSLIDAHGQLSHFERINYHVEDVKDGTSSGYDFHLEFQKPVDTNNTGDLFDLSIPIPDYVPNGMIYVSNINAALSFENYSWLHSENVSTGSIDYDGRIGSDTIDPSINSLTHSQGTRDYPSIIIDGNITDNVQLDYVTFQVKWPDSFGYDAYDSFIIPSSAIDDSGDFSIEYTPTYNNWQ